MTATAVAGYTAVSRRPLDLEDYVDVARRHVAWIAGPFFLGLVVSICIAFSLENTYTSSALIQITPPQIAADLVRTTSNQLLSDRLSQMEGSILSRTSLSNLIQAPDLNLYPTERLKLPIDDVIEIMKKYLRIEIKNSGGLGKQASAFQISFTYNNRYKAKATVEKLISRFFDENETSQKKLQTLGHEYFDDETIQAKAGLEKANDELTKFRVANQGRLPEQSSSNIANLSSLQAQVNAIDAQLNRLAQDRAQYEAHLSALKSQLDLAGMMNQEGISTLPGSPMMRQNTDLETKTKEIDALEAQLALYLQSYTEAYPEVKDARKRLTLLRKNRDELAARLEQQLTDDAAKPKDAVKKVTNFQFLQTQNNLQTQIDATNILLKINDQDRIYKQKEMEKYNKEQEEYRNKLAATSGIEAHYADLQRDQANAAAKYTSMLGKQELQAQSASLVQRRAGEAMEMLDPASLPTQPASPNRWAIVGGGIVASFLLGIAMAGVQEAKDSSLKNLKDVRAYTNLPVLCSIPLLENTLLVKRKRRVAFLAWSAAVIVGIIAICSALFYYQIYIATT